MNTTKNNTTFPQVVEIPKPLEIHWSVSAKAAELLMRASKAIAREPDMYHQGNPAVECGTPCCILGHMEKTMRGDLKFVMRYDHARYGLTAKQGEDLYAADKWPSKFGSFSQLERVPAAIGIARIEHFLRTGE